MPIRNRLLSASLILLALLFVAPSALAADLKIGVVDVEYVVLNSKAGKSAKKKLKRIFDKKQKELDKRQTELLKIKDSLENPSAMETADGRKKKLMEYQRGVLTLQEDFVKNQQDLAKKEMELMEPILKNLEKTLNAIAASGGYDLILNKNQNGVIFAKPDFDITPAVLKKIDS